MFQPPATSKACLKYRRKRIGKHVDTFHLLVVAGQKTGAPVHRARCCQFRKGSPGICLQSHCLHDGNDDLNNYQYYSYDLDNKSDKNKMIIVTVAMITMIDSNDLKTIITWEDVHRLSIFDLTARRSQCLIDSHCRCSNLQQPARPV